LVFIHTTIRWACSNKEGTSKVKGEKGDEDGDDEELLLEAAAPAAAAAAAEAEAVPSPKSRQKFLSRVAPPWMTKAFLFHISFKKYSGVKG
jgi:hypothetical protein